MSGGEIRKNLTGLIKKQHIHYCGLSDKRYNKWTFVEVIS